MTVGPLVGRGVVGTKERSSKWMEGEGVVGTGVGFLDGRKDGFGVGRDDVGASDGEKLGVELGSMLGDDVGFSVDAVKYDQASYKPKPTATANKRNPRLKNESCVNFLRRSFASSSNFFAAIFSS